MKPRTTTSDVTAPPEQSQLEVCNIEDEIGILHRQSVRQWNVFFSHKMFNARNVGMEISGEQPARLHSRRPARPRHSESAKLCACSRREISPGTSSAGGEGYVKKETQLQLQEGMYLL